MTDIKNLRQLLQLRRNFSIPSTIYKSCILPGGMVEAEGDKMLEVQVLVKQEVVLLVQAVLPPD